MILAQKQKYRPVERDSPGISPHTYGHLSFEEAILYNGENTATYQWWWENWTAACKRMKLEQFLIPYNKVNSKWIKDLNKIPENIKLLEENIGKTLNINQSKILYDPPPRVTEIKKQK